MEPIRWSSILVSFLAVVGLSLAEELAPVVTLKDGKVRGTVQLSDDGRKVYAYQGIRYGRASRFAKPTPVEPWTEIYNATHWRDACPQTGFDPRTQTMSEDCLFVSVWLPETKSANRSVMVYFHGGSFKSGTIFSTLYDGRYLASRDVIVVTVNYRLGSLGYLFANTSDAPGNQGLHDQLLALKWVHANIHAFGGDAKRITIFGESAGTLPVSAFILSPLTKGLFHRAILQSGAPTSLMTNAINKPLKRTEYLARVLNCPIGHMNDTLKCLRYKTVDEILTAQKAVISFGVLSTPIMNDEILPFENAVEALKSGKFKKDLDFMWGVTRDEGSIFVAGAFPELDKNETILTVESIRKYILKIYATSPFAKEIADFYTKDLRNASQDELRLTISHAFADPSLSCSTILFGEAVARASPNRSHYSYRLTQKLKTPFPIAGGCGPLRGICHGVDIMYLFNLAKTKSRPEDYELSKQMINAWTSFAKTGNPGKMGTNAVQWTEAFDPKDPYSNHMNLNVKNFTMVKDFFKETCNVFWKPKMFS